MAKKRSRAKRKDIADHPNQKFSDEERAGIWVVFEESGSLRGTSRELGISVSSVQRVLGENTIRYQSIKQRKAEERSERWLRIEEGALDSTHAVIELMDKARAKIAELTTPEQITEALRIMPRHLTALRMAADSATTKTQLLQGRATENVKHSGGVGKVDLTLEQAVELANDLGLEDFITPAIKELVDGGAGGDS